MRIQITDKRKCCGCAACVQVCTKRCISFEEDEEGFRYPSVDALLCIECGQCSKVCPVINQRKTESKPIHVYAQKNPDEGIRLKSSSGGVFSLLSEKTISEGGIVFGAAFDRKWEVCHDYVETIEGLDRLRRSKYLQSRMEENFIKAGQFLEAGRKVLFSGTPCQIAALKLFLKKEYEGLLTVDVICHGVPSPMVWRTYLERLSEKSSSGISDINFRDKTLGWKNYSLKIPDVINHSSKKDPYIKSFLSNLNLRPSCYDCPAKSGKSGSDLTLGDFWGIHSLHPGFDDDKGAGLTIAHTQKGLDAVNSIKAESVEVTLEEGVRNNQSYFLSAAEPPERSDFFSRTVRGEDLSATVSDFTRENSLSKAYRKCRSTLSRIKQIIHGML